MPNRRHSRDPDSFAVLLPSAVAGAVLALTATLPPSVDELVPTWVGVCWATLISVSAGASLIGPVIKDAMNGLLGIMVGRSCLSGAMAAYVVALIAAADSWGSTWIVLVAAGISVSSAVQARRAAKDIQQVTRLVKTAGGDA